MSNKSDSELDEDEDEDEPDEDEGPERGTRLEKRGQIVKKGPSCEGPGKGLFQKKELTWRYCKRLRMVSASLQ